MLLPPMLLRPLLAPLLCVACTMSVDAAEPGGDEDPGAAIVQQLAADFFEWRRSQQPASGDDIPRVERPDGWTPDWSPEGLERYRRQYRDFLRAVDRLETSDWTVASQVDARLLRAAIQRVFWELEILESPHRDPVFYVQQTLGSLFELLLISSPFDEARARNLVLRLEAIPRTLQAASANLDRPIRPFALSAISMLDGIGPRLQAVATAVGEDMPEALHPRLDAAVPAAVSALDGYAAWLANREKQMQTAFAIGPLSYQWFLTNVALLPFTPTELLAQGQQALDRAIAWEELERNRNLQQPGLPLFDSLKRQIQMAELQEGEIRTFLEAKNLMTVPEGLQHYRMAPIPPRLAPLGFMGVKDDLTSETRLDQPAWRYIDDPSPDLGYFALSAARDPRPLIIHEGVPGHYFQLVLSWAQPDPIRRRYIDSSANEGIAFYVEELLLQAGLFDFSPRSREIIYSFMHLRALRVEVDVRLALGEFNVEQAADYLARTVPMDRKTALEEAVFFAQNPGQAISYQVGKLQVLRFLSEAKLDLGEGFSLRDFHDYLLRNGNVPIALQRWEYLDREDDVLRLDALGGQTVTVPR